MKESALELDFLFFKLWAELHNAILDLLNLNLKLYTTVVKSDYNSGGGGARATVWSDYSE